MTQPMPIAKTGQNFAMTNLGQFADLRQFVFAAATMPMEVEGKVFLKQVMELTSAEISLNSLPPKTSIPFYHKHRLNEEIYVALRGTGQFQVDDCVFPFSEGTVVRVDPDGERCLRNLSETEDLHWIVIQARAGSYSGDHTIQDGVGVQKRVSWVGKSLLSD